MPKKQIPGWTRKGPGTFTSDEFDSDDQTPPNSVSKVTSSKPIPSADALLTAKNVAGEEPISSADTIPAVQNYIQNFAAYLGGQFMEIHSKLCAKGQSQEALQLKEEVFALLLRWEQAATTESGPVTLPPESEAGKTAADLPAAPEKVEDREGGDTVIDDVISIRGTQEKMMRMKTKENTRMARESDIPEDVDLELVPTFVNEGPDDGWSSVQSFDNWCAIRTKVAPWTESDDYQKKYHSEHAIVQKQKLEILRLHELTDRQLVRIDRLNKEIRGIKLQGENVARWCELEDQAQEKELLDRALLFKDHGLPRVVPSRTFVFK